MNIKIIIILSIIVLILLSCLVIGFIFYGKNVFNNYHLAFSLIICGFYAAVFFSVLYSSPLRNAVSITILIFVMYTLIRIGKRDFIYYIRDVVFFGTFLLSLIIYHSRVKNLKLSLLLQPLFLAALVGLFGMINPVLLYGIVILISDSTPPDLLSTIFISFKISFLTGLSIGIGLLIFNKIDSILQKS